MVDQASALAWRTRVVEHTVEELDEEVHRDEEDDHDEEGGLHGEVLAGEHATDDEAAEPRDGEDPLDDDRAADEGADVQAGRR